MNFKNRYIFISTIFGMLLLSGCGKDAIDHRFKYLGDWEFEVHTGSFNVDSVGAQESKSFTYNGKIVAADCCDKIGIIYGPDLVLVIKVDEQGEFYEEPSKYSNIQFDGSDKIHGYLYWGGLGGGVSHTFDGVKR